MEGIMGEIIDCIINVFHHSFWLYIPQWLPACRKCMISIIGFVLFLRTKSILRDSCRFSYFLKRPQFQQYLIKNIRMALSLKGLI